MNKTKQFTHNDLDGVGCGVLTELSYGRNGVEISYCDYDNIDEEIIKFTEKKDLKDYSNILITDIGITKETSEQLDKLYKEINIKYFDHHKTNMWINDYEWATVRERVERGLGDSKEIVKDSATNIYYEYLLDNYLIYPEEGVDYFVEEIRRYDTWDWVNIYKTQSPNQLNDLLYIYGIDEFKKKMLYKLTREKSLFSVYNLLDEYDNYVINLETTRKNKYIEEKLSNITTMEVSGYTAGVVYLERYHSELCNRLLECNLDIDIAIGINMQKGTVSYRSREDGIDVSIIASKYGGGGHKNASGSEIAEDLKNKIISEILY